MPRQHDEDNLDLARIYERVFATDDGQRVLRDLQRQFGVFRTTFITGAPDASAFGEGERNVVLYIQGQIQKTMPLEGRAIIEAAERSKADQHHDPLSSI